MKKSKAWMLFVFLYSFIPVFAYSAEFISGALRLVLHEDTGRFSLYALGEGNQRQSQALFAAQDPRTSFLSVMVNDRSYKLGDSASFRTRVSQDAINPSLVFESSFMHVTMEFTFTRNPVSSETNGVSVSITLENRSDRQINTGARFLLDTHLGEGISPLHFTTDRRTILSEALLSGTDGDRFWTDTNNRVSLTGSLYTGVRGEPDSVHIANWKKLSDASWRAQYHHGRNFNFPPYSVNDTAVCYYYEPHPLGQGEKRNFGFVLGIESGAGFHTAPAEREIAQDLPVWTPAASLSPLVAPDLREQDLRLIRELMAQIDAYLASGTATEEELNTIESTLNGLRAKYGPANYR